MNRSSNVKHFLEQLHQAFGGVCFALQADQPYLLAGLKESDLATSWVQDRLRDLYLSAKNHDEDGTWAAAPYCCFQYSASETWLFLTYGNSFAQGRALFIGPFSQKTDWTYGSGSNLKGLPKFLSMDRWGPIGHISALIFHGPQARFSYVPLIFTRAGKKTSQALLPDIDKSFRTYIPGSVMQVLKASISTGNREALDNFLNSQSGNFYDLFYKTSLSLREIKNRSIFICAVCTEYAIEGGMLVDDAWNLSNAFIKTFEDLSSFQDIPEVLMSFFKACVQGVIKAPYGRVSLRTKEIIHFLRDNLHRPLHLHEIAQHFNLSDSYFSLLLKNETGLAYKDLLDSLRMEKAQSLLRYSKKSIREIAEALGYSYANHFCRVFKKQVGKTPLQYRHQ